MNLPTRSPAALAVVVALLLGAVVRTAAAGERTFVPDAEQLVVDLVLEARAAEGHPDVGPVVVQPDLTVAAREWSTHMADAGVSHDPDLATSVCCWTSVADLVAGADAPVDPAEHEASVRVAFETWMAGEGNRANVLRDHVDHVGVGVLHDTVGRLWITVVLREWDGSDLDADHVAPTVAITSPPSGTRVTGSVEVAGTAADDVALDQVLVRLGGDTAVRATVAPDGTWTALLDTAGVDDGTTALTATAWDTSGNQAADQVAVVVDDVPDAPEPTATATEPTPSDQPTDPAPTEAPPTDDHAGHDEPGVVRLAGPTRHETAAVVSRAVRDAADTVVLAWSGGFADALAGGPLAAAEDAPLLLNPTDVGVPGDGVGLDAAVVSELRRLEPSTVVLLGGTAVLGEDVADHVRSLVGADVVRVAGPDRWATAAAIGERLAPSEHAYVVEGTAAWPDAVSVGAVAASTGSPILLSGRDTVPAATLDLLRDRGVTHVTLVGGTAVLTPAVADRLAATGVTVTRLGGADRYATSAAVAGHAVTAGLSDGTVWVATGRNFPDALAAGPAAAAQDATVLLVDGLAGGTDAALWSWLEARTWTRATVVGGEHVVAPVVASRLAGMVR